jgi:aerobic-type carbon monoxide dehydrogenase small subunit (CoxS/CutS family)
MDAAHHSDGETRLLRVTVNEHSVEAVVPVRRTLADFLRQNLGLTGTHLGCEHGVCGACTVLANGQAVRACLMLAVQADGYAVTTIEGLAPSESELHPLQEAFCRFHGLQCGFCTPGLLMTLVEFLAEVSDPTEEQIRVAISGNICRCTGYHSIIAATMHAAARMREAAATP